MAKEIPTYIILNQDTVSNSDIEQLQSLDMLNIRDVIFQVGHEPYFHEWVLIKQIETKY